MKYTSFSIARFRRAIASEFRTRATVRALQGFDDRLLADMGITRGEIDGRVRAAWRRGQ